MKYDRVVCESKKSYKSMAEAKKHAEYCIKIKKKSRRMKPYKCKVCGMYHLASHYQKGEYKWQM